MIMSISGRNTLYGVQQVLSALVLCRKNIYNHIHDNLAFFCSMLGADFSAASVVVTFGILLGRVSPLQLLVVSLVECVFYSANEALNLHVLQAQDPGGSLQIHVFGTYFGLFTALTLYKGWGTEDPPKYPPDPSYVSNMFAMIGE